MDEEKNCQLCGQRQTCRQAYQKLGDWQGPSVVSKVVVVFLLPMAVFIATLIIAEAIMAKTAVAEGLATIISFISAITITFVFVLVASGVYKIAGKNK